MSFDNWTPLTRNVSGAIRNWFSHIHAALSLLFPYTSDETEPCEMGGSVSGGVEG
jgi:hypothetical protein